MCNVENISSCNRENEVENETKSKMKQNRKRNEVEVKEKEAFTEYQIRFASLRVAFYFSIFSQEKLDGRMVFDKIIL